LNLNLLKRIQAETSFGKVVRTIRIRHQLVQLEKLACNGDKKGGKTLFGVFLFYCSQEMIT
jgi:hypothetical protein